MNEAAAKASKSENEHAVDLLKEFDKEVGDRTNWDSHWQEIAERIWPNQSNLFQSRNQSQTQGEKRTEYVFDSTASIGLTRFASIFDSMLTPQNQRWHRAQPSDDGLMKDRATRLWFDQLNSLLFKVRYSPRGNFASQNQMNFKMLGAYGSGCVFTDDLRLPNGKKDGIRYRTMHLSGVYFKENHQGIVDTVYRYYKQTARQAYQEWGDNLPGSIKTAYHANSNAEFWFLHCVKPRRDYDPQRQDAKGKEWASYYVSRAEAMMLDEGGYDSFPYSIGRHEQAPGEVYGRSPAMDVLPAIKTLNEMKKAMLKQGHRALDPILLAYDDGVADSFSFRPGAINSGGVSQDGRALVQALPIGQLQAGKENMDDERAVVNDAFLITLFQILTEAPQMTATEVMERTREKGILLAPTMGRQQSEYLGPLIEREIDILMKQGKLPPLPPALIEAKGEYRIEYESPMARAAKAEEVTGLMRTVETAISVATQTQNPEPLDHFNWDVIVPKVCDIQGVPVEWRNSEEAIAAIRQGRQQALQQQQTIAAAPGAAAITKAAAVAKEAQNG